ncbi:restriction endonuclease [Pelobium sp.]|nr:restriction endonuclease [Pelobium sp.]MDA9555094.1 restriction endonuclease [Pelobium sp.]
MTKNWYDFQESIRSYFLTLGCEAKTNVSIHGVRTKHDIDIFITSKFLGIEIKWIIEAKKWKTKVSKLHVLALRQIVDDIGADKGFIIADSGFQKGAIESTKNTNIYLLTFQQLIEFSKNIIHKEILEGYHKRLNLLLNRYYSHDKKIRIKYELREESGGYDTNFNFYVFLIALSRAITKGINNSYPIEFDNYLNEYYGEKTAENYFQLINWLNLNFLILEEKLFRAEIEMQKNGDFNPKLFFKTIEENHQMLIMKIFK